MNLTFRERVYPTKKQHARFAEYLRHTQQLYNAALQERIDCYQKTRKTLTAVDQSRELTQLRADPDYAIYPRRMQRWAINLVETAYRGMFTRHKKGEKLGVPRFRSSFYWNTFGFDSPVDFRMRARGLCNKKAFGGTLRLRPSRPLPPFEKCTMAIFSRDDDRWFVSLTYEVPDVAPKPAPSRPVGLDVGLQQPVMRSDGVLMDMPRQIKSDTAAQRRAARALARCRRRSKRRRKVRARLRKINNRIARKRTARLHEITARLTHHFDGVAIEDLSLRGLTNMGASNAQGRGIRKAWRDRAPGRLAEMLTWKTQRDGRHFARVDPRRTTIECADCGASVVKALRERTHRCECGAVRDRDHNAALNILARAGWGPGNAKPDGRSAAVAASDAGLFLKHEGRKAVGPRQRRARARPPPSPFFSVESW